jgi:hypothetical protein
LCAQVEFFSGIPHTTRIKAAEKLRRKMAIALVRSVMRLPELLKARRAELQERIGNERDLLLAYFNLQAPSPPHLCSQTSPHRTSPHRTSPHRTSPYRTSPRPAPPHPRSLLQRLCPAPDSRACQLCFSKRGESCYSSAAGAA